MEKKLKKVQRGAAFGFVVLKILRILLIILALVAVIAVGGVGLGYCVYKYLYESTGSLTIVADEVYVNDIAVGGMTMDEAREVMTGIENDLAAEVKVEITAGEKKYRLTKKDFPCSFDTEEIFEKIRTEKKISDELEVVGKGSHCRFIVDGERFQTKADNKII